MSNRGAAAAPAAAAAGALTVWLERVVASLYPGGFALVMATAIISNAMRLLGRRDVSDALFVVALVALPWLGLLTLARLAFFRRRLWADLVNPRMVFSFFTIVAATDVVAVGLGLRGLGMAVAALWTLALIAWLGLIYFSFGVLTFLNTAQGVGVVHGGWLIAIVGTESLVIPGTMVAPMAGNLAPTVFVLVHMLWGVGIGLYGIFVTLFAYRIFFFEFGPDDVTPLLWVVMGAAAISANAGSTLLLTGSGMPFLMAMRPFIEGSTLILWAWATWWIPLLVLFGLWKHGVLGVQLAYTPMLWSLVFPLGMYALASLKLSLASDFAPLQALAGAMVWVAFTAWLATAAGLVRASWRGFRAIVDERAGVMSATL
jgi:tellurite resistance protein TehA-like permease